MDIKIRVPEEATHCELDVPNFGSSQENSMIKSLENIPQEIMIKILWSLPMHSIILGISLTCKTLRNVCSTYYYGYPTRPQEEDQTQFILKFLINAQRCTKKSLYLRRSVDFSSEEGLEPSNTQIVILKTTSFDTIDPLEIHAMSIFQSQQIETKWKTLSASGKSLLSLMDKNLKKLRVLMLYRLWIDEQLQKHLAQFKLNFLDIHFCGYESKLDKWNQSDYHIERLHLSFHENLTSLTITLPFSLEELIINFPHPLKGHHIRVSAFSCTNLKYL